MTHDLDDHLPLPQIIDGTICESRPSSEKETGLNIKLIDPVFTNPRPSTKQNDICYHHIATDFNRDTEE